MIKSKNNISKLEMIRIWMNSTSKFRLTKKKQIKKVKSKLDQQIKILISRSIRRTKVQKLINTLKFRSTEGHMNCKINRSKL